MTHHTPKSVTIARLENALRYLAGIVAEFGKDAMPLFEAVEQELAAMCAQEAGLQRALRLAGAA